MSLFDYYWKFNSRHEEDYVNVHNEPNNRLFGNNVTPKYSYIEDMPFKDFTFVCTDGEVKAHRCVLWTRCEFFKTKTWKINDVFKLEVDFTMEVVQKVIDLIYGHDVNICDLIDFSGYAFLDMINPSLNNAYMLISNDVDEFDNILDKEDEFESVGISIDRIINIMANYIMNAYHVVEYSYKIPIEIVNVMLESDYMGYEDDIVIYINDYINYNALSTEDMQELCSKIRWEYVENLDLSDKMKKQIPQLTIEQIRDAYVNPHHRKVYTRFIDMLVGGIDEVYSYDRDYIQVLGKKYRLSKVFSREEYDKLIQEE